jgi:hypothetical protein
MRGEADLPCGYQPRPGVDRASMPSPAARNAGAARLRSSSAAQAGRELVALLEEKLEYPAVVWRASEREEMIMKSGAGASPSRLRIPVGDLAQDAAPRGSAPRPGGGGRPHQRHFWETMGMTTAFRTTGSFQSR